jgi:hypothetical protein
MLNAYIIDKIKRERELEEMEQWQPIPLPLEEYDPGDRIERKKEEEKEEHTRRGVVVIQVQGSKDSQNLVL